MQYQSDNRYMVGTVFTELLCLVLVLFIVLLIVAVIVPIRLVHRTLQRRTRS
jgi:hypothetical protein